jgi:hypothetical protein
MFLPLILVAVVTVGALVYVARPLFGNVKSPPAAHADDLAARRLELVEERDRALAALKELEFDHRTGKVSDVDYRELIGPLRTRAVETLRLLEPAGQRVRSARSSRRQRRPKAKVRS